MKKIITGFSLIISSQSFAVDAVLPPALTWDDSSSRSILDNVPAEWKTPVEKMDFASTPDYEATLQFLQKLDRNSALIQLQEFGRSAQGRPLYVVIASLNGEKDLLKRRHSDAARVFIQAGIHAGEIDGKDAGLLLLRDFARGKQLDLLKHSDWYFVPVFNVDGHEKRDGNNQRINQRGPANMGWRTSATNHNLNRDYMKADTPEMQAMLKLISTINPELYLDIHVTDGIDYQYDITYGYSDDSGHSPAISRFLDSEYRAHIDQQLTLKGHIPGPLIFAMDNTSPASGLQRWNGAPRFSQHYGSLRHMPALLVENHSLKPYRQRVLGTYHLYTETLRMVGEHRALLRQAIRQDSNTRRNPLPFNWQYTENANREPLMQDYAGVRYEWYESPVSGTKELRWMGEERDEKIPVIRGEATLFVQRPRAFYIPPQWKNAVDVLKRHGIAVEELKTAQTKSLHYFRLLDAKINAQSFEGRVGAKVEQVKTEVLTREIPAGSWRINTDQTLGDVAIALLDPRTEDSLFSWGYFLSILQATEYAENYVVEPMAQQMLENDPSLKAEFELALQDKAFANDPSARLHWFYVRSGFADTNHLLYPIAFEP